MISCPACGEIQPARINCAKCGAPLGADLDYFAAFDLPRKLCLDEGLLETRYHERGRQIHPDRFASASPKVRDASMRATALLTRAYRVLREPIARASYWLELSGRPLGANNQVPPELAAIVFEIQEELAEFGAAHGDEANELHGGLARRLTEVADLAAARRRELDEVSAELDAAGGEKAALLAARLETIVASLAYMRTLVRNLEKALDTRVAA